MLFAFHRLILCRSVKLVGIEEVQAIWKICRFYMQGLKALKKPRSLARETKLKYLILQIN